MTDLVQRNSPHPNLIQTRDGAALYFRDWGTGKPIVFLHSWSANSDLWQHQIHPLTERGLRCVAFDRRGHGRSSEPACGYDYDTLADDLAAVLERLDLRDAMLVGHSMAAGEIVRYLSRHGAGRVDRIVLVAPTTPCLLKSSDNPDGVPQAYFDQLAEQWCRDFPGWAAENVRPFFGPEASDAMLAWAINMIVRCPLKVAIECTRTYAGADFRPELPKITVPALIIHGDNDASARLELTALRTAALIPNSQLIIYEGATHGLMLTCADRFNRDLLEFAGLPQT